MLRRNLRVVLPLAAIGVALLIFVLRRPREEEASVFEPLTDEPVLKVA